MKESEIALENRQSGRSGSNGGDLRNQESRIASIIAHFNSSWKSSLDSLNGEVLNSFPNFKNGTNILQQALTQFVQYYHRFVNTIFICYSRGSLINDVMQLIGEYRKVPKTKRPKSGKCQNRTSTWPMFQT